MTDLKPVDVDVVVVGAGTAGLQAACQLAGTGRSVVVLERRAEAKSGARWCNGIVDWQFERAGLTPPAAPELRVPAGAPVHLVSPSGRTRFTIDDGPVAEADMRLLVERLRGLALDAGVDLRWNVTDPRLQLVDGRPTAIEATTPAGPIALRADLFVDASGAAGVLRSQVPALASACPPVAPTDLCSAQQLMVEIDDRDGALRFLAEQSAEPGDTIITLAVSGGYSISNIKVEESLHEASLLTGSIPALGNLAAPELLKGIRAEHPWLGKTVFGGGSLIPLRRVYDRFTAPGIALVGDAACQVMPGHGSGIGLGLIAGKVLAEATATARDPGDADALWRYQSGYLREFGALCGAYDVVRRMSDELGPDGVEELMAAGVLGPSLVRLGLDQRLGLLSVREAWSAAKGLAVRPALARVVVPALAAMGAARALYAAYPKRRSDRAFATWQRAASRLLPRQVAG